MAIPKMEMTASEKPKKLEPASPIKVLAGLKLNGKNPASAPAKAVIISMAIIGEPFKEKIINSDKQDINEIPEEIIKEIEVGIKKVNEKYTSIVDRIEAIKYAINMATKADIIVLSGKGHETYQEINGKKQHLDEREIINQIIK